MGRDTREKVEADVADVLQRAGSRVREGWTQHQAAADGRGTACDALYPEASCWCATGAIKRAACDLLGGEDAVTYETLMSLYNRAVVAFHNHLVRERVYVGFSLEGLARRRTVQEAYDAARAVQVWNDCCSSTGLNGAVVAAKLEAAGQGGLRCR